MSPKNLSRRKTTQEGTRHASKKGHGSTGGAKQLPRGKAAGGVGAPRAETKLARRGGGEGAGCFFADKEGLVVAQ